ncbi:cell wall metabolism sensor histidine kinase WalK [Paenibacillus glycanilyticus]|uniref:sensor histidine kinase n=1 Tax=Paenibacillus glycanilyticus TaxID=126569 RepID=UPI00203C01B7|nr:HAMP domain-containing sensor histidine kinase [Paenibacillus glycanilyticus]MCM3628368.1 cell wall metabolism sensor histidine kinase WalK [Paenibacillus glycanilyticus]
MRKHGVVLKLFVITSALILFIFSLVMLAEGLFFERFYRMSRVDELESAMSRFAEQYNEVSGNERELSSLLGSFMNKNDTSTAVLNKSFTRANINPYYVKLQSADKLITVPIPTAGATVNTIPRGISQGERMVIDGMFMDEKDTILHPVAFWPDDTAPLEDGLVRVEGNVTEYMLPEQRSFNPLYQDALLDEALREWTTGAEAYLSRLHEGKTVRSEWKDPWSGVEYAVLVQSLTDEPEGSEHYMFVMASLQPVGEAVETLKKYVIYLAPVILALVLALSLIYSRIVSRPLLTLNRSAARLAKLDFADHPEIRSKDEFGELSRNMNELSRNLDSALKELRLANEQLQEDVREKQRSEQLRKELVANISHELKTPLGIVKGFAEGLQDGVADDKRERYLGLIVNETDRMNALIMDMLELSKFEVKAVRLQVERFSMTDLVRQVANSFMQQLESKHLRLRVRQDGEEDLYVQADRRRIEQVLLNLFSNAIRHATEDSVLTIDMERTEGSAIRTVIENAGPPIAKEDLDRIWDQFYRAERSRDRKSGGTGLGLAIVKHILELHGSNYGAANTEQGVAFSFTLQENKGENLS